MSESLTRRKPIDSKTIDIIKSRRGLMTKDGQTFGGKSTSVRNPCWVKLTGHDKRCGGGGSYELPRKAETWDSVYKDPGFKPEPDIESVTFEYGGDWGLAQKLSATIKCYKVSDFLTIQKYFLMPGNEIDVSFGYSSDVTWGYAQFANLKGFTVATFSFSAGQDGTWICTFEAVSASTAIKTLDMQSVVCNGCTVSSGIGPSGNSGPIKYITGNDKIQHAVKGVAQLIAADAQKNGKYSIDDQKDGDVITKLENYQPGTTYGKEAAVVVFTGEHLRNLMGKFQAWVGGILKDIGFGKSEVETANNQVFVTLGYIVHRIIDDQLLRSLTCQVPHDRDKFNQLKVEFHKKYSLCKITPGITSGDPTTMLLIGDANYKNNNGEGKDFDHDCQQPAVVKAIDAGGNVKLQNILLHRDVVTAAFNSATAKKESESDSTDVKNTKEEVVNIVNFFDAIAEHIKSCTGGAIALRLVEDPDDNKKLIVVDQNYGVSQSIPCVVFNPINGDGSTRSCEIQSNVGSQEYRAAMFVGTSKNGDSVANLRGCSEKLKIKRGDEAKKAKEDKEALIKNPGNLGKNEFDGQEINALKSVMGRLYRSNENAVSNESLHYPGLSISVTIDGVYGFVPGCAISSTQVPHDWRSAPMNSYFMITSVQHSFQGSDWATKLDGILAYYDKIEYTVL